ncbi:MAG: DUF3108 domain-containing protein [Gammaproteobacteria bacterium]|nr:DUF3108 domain-containing protein [Gammaproteobacteria bacterium]
MLTLSRILIALLLAGVVLTASAETNTKNALQPFTAHYKGRANGFAVGDLGARELKALGGGRYRLQYTAEALIYSLQETSEFTLTDGLLQPQLYRSDRGTFMKRRKVSLDFDWDRNLASFDYKGEAGQFNLQAGAQDPLSGSIVLAQLLLAGKPTIEYLEADKKGIEANQLELIDQPVLETELGKIPTWHLKRLHANPKRKTEIWLHKEYPAIPVKVHQIDDADEFQLELVRFELQ